MKNRKRAVALISAAGLLSTALVACTDGRACASVPVRTGGRGASSPSFSKPAPRPAPKPAVGNPHGSDRRSTPRFHDTDSDWC